MIEWALVVAAAGMFVWAGFTWHAERRERRDRNHR